MKSIIDISIVFATKTINTGKYAGIHLNKLLSFVTIPESEIKEAKPSKDYIILKSDKKNYKIQFEDILYIESLDNYIKVHTTEFSIICYESLSGIEKELLSADFIRIHRSYIVNYSKVDVFTSAFVEIAGSKFTIGRNYRDEVIKRFS